MLPELDAECVDLWEGKPSFRLCVGQLIPVWGINKIWFLQKWMGTGLVPGHVSLMTI